MGQKLHLIRGDKYRLNIEAFNNAEFDEIKRGESKYNYRFSIKEKFSSPPLESYEANILDEKIGFSFNVKIKHFGTYLYVIEKLNLMTGAVEDLSYGFIDILPDI